MLQVAQQTRAGLTGPCLLYQFLDSANRILSELDGLNNCESEFLVRSVSRFVTLVCHVAVATKFVIYRFHRA